MRRIWVTSDLHIGHNKEFVYKERGFQSIEEHDSALLSNWNELVSPDDVVYVLGDVMLKKDLEDEEFSYALNILKQLNGELIIFRGNHDSESKLKKYETCENVIKAGEAACYLKYPAVKVRLSVLSVTLSNFRTISGNPRQFNYRDESVGLCVSAQKYNNKNLFLISPDSCICFRKKAGQICVENQEHFVL